MRLVLDCSVAVKWFVPEVDSAIAEGCLLRERSGEIEFIAPDIFVAEVGHTLRRHVLRGLLPAEDGHTALAELDSVRIDLVPSRPLARRAWELAVAHQATFYDALYVALALSRDARLLTADERMANAFQRLDRIVLLSQFSA